MTEYLVPYESAESEFEEKRSRFISHVFLVESEAEARARIDEMKKKYYDARHNCWCFVLHDGTVRYGDDGEPQGTAGQPMLNVFQRENVENVVCIVTRYFGGILLGVGARQPARAEQHAAEIPCNHDRHVVNLLPQQHIKHRSARRLRRLTVIRTAA